MADGAEVITWDPGLLKEAAGLVGKTTPALYVYEEKEGKEGREPSKILKSISVGEAAPEAAEVAGVAPPIDTGPEVVPTGPQRPAQGLVGQPSQLPVPVSVRALTDLESLEYGYMLAKRQHELVLDLVKGRMREGTHYVDGAMFGGKRPVLLQPGAHCILQSLRYSCSPTIISGPTVAPGLEERYTIVVKCDVANADGKHQGSQMGSCSSHIWSNKAGRFVPRAVDPDKTHNSTLKMAVKRATVAVTRQTTPASELFQEDIDEGGYGEPPTEETAPRKGGFIKR